MPDQLNSAVEVIVSVDESHLCRLKEIAEQLSANGLMDVQTLASIGAVTGKGLPESLPALGNILGVSAVELADGVQIAPPDADIQ